MIFATTEEGQHTHEMEAIRGNYIGTLIIDEKCAEKI